MQNYFLGLRFLLNLEVKITSNTM